MNAEFWLKVRGKRDRYKKENWLLDGPPKTSISKPDCGSDELCFKVTINIPNEYFEVPQVNLKVEMPKLSDRPMLNIKVQEKIAAMVAKDMGLKVHVLSSEDPNV